MGLIEIKKEFWSPVKYTLKIIGGQGWAAKILEIAANRYPL